MEIFSGLFNFENFLYKDWSNLLVYFPLGVIGIWRWAVWTFKKIISFFYQNPLGNFKGTLSIVTPVYNEDPTMFRLALLSWQENKPEEIIAVIDYTDKKCIKAFESFSQDFKGAKLIITRVPGKRQALARGIKNATSDIVALVDSDTIWTQGFKEKIIGPFENEKVGGVAPRQDVMEANTIAKKLFRIHIFNRYGNDLIFQAAFGKALSCISGRTGIYRRSAISKLTRALTNEKFLGKKCISGDDKRLTNLVQRNGWDVLYMERALVLTPGFSDLKTYIKQQIRWTRNSWRSDITSLASRWLWKNPFLAFHTIDRFLQPFTLILGPIFLFIAIYRGDWIIACILVAWWLISRSMKIAPYLMNNPKELLIIPVHIAFGYLLAVVKIFTLITVDEQSWITRWSKNRMAVTGIFRRWISYAATFSIVFFLFFLSFEYNVNLSGGSSFWEKRKNEKVEAQMKVYRTEEGSRLAEMDDEKIRKVYEAAYQNVTADQYGYYQAGFRENLNDVRKKFLLAPDAVILKENKEIFPANYYLQYQERLAIPVEELQNPKLSYYKESSRLKAIVTYDYSEDAIRIKGKGSFTNIPDLSKAINNKKIIEDLGNKEWILRKNLYIDDGVTLEIDGNEVGWLKLKSGKDGFSWIKAQGGNIFISQSKITSWDEENSDYDREWQDGRSYILQKTSGRLDITGSELAYLGNLGSPNRGNPFGGPYGISWKISDGSLKNELSTGLVENNVIHHNYFGIYTFGATGIIFRGNIVYENVEYGIDPHDDSNNLIIEGNHVSQNGNHGIITSKRCYSNIIRNNTSNGNKLHGIMLDRDSNRNLVDGNISLGNINGIAINGSSENLIVSNRFEENSYGIRANNFSKNNYIGYNSINGNQKGIFFYSNSGENYLFWNDFKENGYNIHLKENSGNFISKEWAEKLFEIK